VSLAQVADAVAAAAAALSGSTELAATPLERTTQSPGVWCTAAAARVGVDPGELAARLSGHPLFDGATVGPGGLVRVRLAPATVVCALRELAEGKGMPPAPPSSSPPSLSPPSASAAEDPGADVRRFEAARTAGGAPALPASLLERRVLDNPVVTVQLAHARACVLADRHPATVWTSEDAAAGEAAGIGDLRVLLDPLDRRVVTEVLDAPRRLELHKVRPHETAATLQAVATAYLPWWEGVTRGPAAELEPARVLLSAAARGVLERGMALLGVSAPARM